MGERADKMSPTPSAGLYTGPAGSRLGRAPEEKDSTEIAADIGHTRAEMSETVDALQKKLAPNRLVDDFLDSVRESLDRNSSRIFETMRQHPVVTSCVGLGLGWLLLQSTARTRPTYGAMDADYCADDVTAYEGESVGARLSDTASGISDSVKAGAAAARDKAGELAAGTRDQVSHITGRARQQASHLAGQAGRYAKEQAGYIAGRARDQVSHLAGEAAGYAREQAGHLAGRARDQVGALGNAATSQARHAAGRFGDMVYENPFAVATIGLAVGAVVGFLLPETRRENELMGDARDTLLDKAKGAASDTFDRVQQVAVAAKDAAMEEAQKQNLTFSGQPEQGAPTGTNLTTSAVDTGKEQSKGQGSGSDTDTAKSSAPFGTTGSSARPYSSASAKDDKPQGSCAS